MLLDFGAARQTINTDAPMLAPMYTPGFAPPELYIKGAGARPLVRHLQHRRGHLRLHGRRAAAAGRCSAAEDKHGRAVRRLDGAYSPELVAMVRACLALDPLARPQSVFAVQKVLQAAPARCARRPQAAAAPASGWRGLSDASAASGAAALRTFT
jgi:serine/threonine protein kinase